MKLAGNVEFVIVNFCLLGPGFGVKTASATVDVGMTVLVVGTGKMLYFVG